MNKNEKNTSNSPYHGRNCNITCTCWPQQTIYFLLKVLYIKQLNQLFVALTTANQDASTVL